MIPSHRLISRHGAPHNSGPALLLWISQAIWITTTSLSSGMSSPIFRVRGACLSVRRRRSPGSMFPTPGGMAAVLGTLPRRTLAPHEVERSVYQRDVRQRLGKIAEEAAIDRVVFL